MEPAARLGQNGGLNPDRRNLQLVVDNLICAVLRGERPVWPGDEQDLASLFLARANHHGVVPLLNIHLAGVPWPAAVGQACRNQARALAMWELRHQQVLAEMLVAAAAVGLVPILIKGTALAYSIYADPSLRSRADTDLLVPETSQQQAHALLVALGYRCVEGVPSYQASYTMNADDGTRHTLDLHWKINNSELLSDLFHYDELRKHAEPLPKLCSQAIGASLMHALLLACMHRATHKQNPYHSNGTEHHDPDRMIWLYDVHLLSGRLSAADWQAFVAAASEKGLRAVCLEGMQRAAAVFGTLYPQDVIPSLASASGEAPERYLNASGLKQQWIDLQALGSLGAQVRWISAQLIPPAKYMRLKYADSRFQWLPWLYLRRAMGGVLKRTTGH